MSGASSRIPMVDAVLQNLLIEEVFRSWVDP